jgi:hypothetical protein
MGDLESLLFVLAVIYLTECAGWVRRGAVAFRGFGTGRWHLRHPEGVLANQRGAIVLANPLPPLDPLILCGQFPLSLSAEAIYSYTAASLNPGWRAPQLARFVLLADITSLATAQKRILVNDELFLRASSPNLARRWARLIQRLREAPAAKREPLIRQAIADGFDVKRLRQRLEDFRSQTLTLRALSNVLFAFLFGIAPGLAWFYGLRHVGLFLLAGLLAQTVPIALLFRREHKALYPDADDERFTRFLTMLLAPPTAIRAVDLLGRHLLEEFHPVAVAQVLCSPEGFRGFACGALIDLRFPFFPSAPTNDASTVNTEQWFRREAIAAVESAVRRAGLDPDKLVRSPAPTDPSHQSCCPRCGAQFVVAEGTCADCGGLPLVSWK